MPLRLLLAIVLGMSWAGTGRADETGTKAKPQPKIPIPKISIEHPSSVPASEGKVRTSLFGTSGEGYKFVYVFDRSGSMGGSGTRSLRAVKKELQKSLANLDTVHQFQIIFYNDTVRVFNPTGTPGRLPFATEQTKNEALRFIHSTSAEGGTRHEDAIKMAIRLRPDVIFLLTDGDEPRLSRRQLESIERQAAGITINTIEFGPGPEPATPSFLKTLAEENGGQYAYVDTTKFGEE